MQSCKSLLLFVLVTVACTAACASRGTHATENDTARQDISWGNRLYDENCSACHGNNGKGGVGVPLSLPAFIDQVDDTYLVKTIRHGRPGRIMPAFDTLNNEQTLAIVVYMRSWSDRRAPQYSVKAVSGNPQHGAQLYAKYCSSCHGINGEGGHGTGVTYSRPRSLPIIAPALNNSGFLASASDAMIKHTISHGRKKTPMPAFLGSHGLHENDINDIVRHIRNFKPSANKTIIDESAYIMRESPYSFEETLNNVKNAIASANMRLIRVQNVEDRLFPPSLVNQKQKIVYGCGFAFLNEALKVDSRIGLFLPCRVTIVEHQGKVKLYTINPTRLSVYFNNNELHRLCMQMRDTYTDVLDEAIM